MTKTYYHATPFENLESIMVKDQEIHRGCDGVVYLAEKPNDALKFLVIRGYTKILVIGVALEENEVEESFDHSEAFFKCKAYMYNKDIKLDNFTSVQTFEY